MTLLINKAISCVLTLGLELSEAVEGYPEVRFQILVQVNQSISLLNTACCLLRYPQSLR